MLLEASDSAIPVTETGVRPRSLRRSVIFSAVGNFIYLACQYGLLMAIAKYGDTESVGQFALALAVAAPIIMLSQMQLRQLQVTDVRGAVAFADYIRHRVLFSAAALAIIVAIGVAYGGRTGLVIAWVGAAKAFESVSDVAYGRMQRHERLDLVAISMAAKGILSLIVFGALMVVSRDLVTAVAGLTLVWALLLFVFDLPVQRRVGREMRASAGTRAAILRSLTRTAMPLAWTSGVVSLSASLPRYFLDAMQGKEAVAIFAVAATPLVLANLLLGSVTQAALPRAATYFQTGDLHRFHRLGIRLAAIHVAFGLLFAVIFALAGRTLISWLFTPEFVDAVPLMVIMSLGTALGGMGAYGAVVLSAGRHFSLQLVNVLVMVLIQVLSAYWLIRSFGVLGAGWSEFIRYGASAVFLLVTGWLVFHSRKRMSAATL